jgi:DNA polymerase III delta prime subunit
MSVKEKLFWEKYRPKELRGMILLPRIEALVKDGIQMNLIFYGTSGTGKTSLANILSKEYNFLKINASKENGIETLRLKIETYLNTMVAFTGKQGMKIIYLDEFDRATPQLQDGLKSFIEAYETRARFIFTTNHINKITKELKSRFTEVSFDPIDKSEREYLYKKHISYIRAIAKQEKFERYTETEPFVKIINKHFPDLRKSIQTLQEAIITNSIDSLNISTGSDKLEFYNYLLDKDTNPVTIYDFVMNNFFSNFEDAYEYLGRAFFEYLKDYNIDIVINKGAAILNTQKCYNETYPVTPDPIIHLINYILDIKTILTK